MGTVDDRVVNLNFNNKQFENAAMQSMSTLDKLKQSLNFSSSSKGVDQLAASVKGVQMDPLATSVEGVSGKFLALATVGVTALATITNMAVQAGLSITKSLTITPIGAGFSEYELKMGAIQTIMAGSGEKLQVVNKYLNQLNEYSDRTIYSFSDMTQNIGKFTNAGVNLKTSVAAIQGIANVAAVSGANAEEASRAMYNFAQALSKGSVALIDWKSIEFANMATVEFKTNLLNAAVATGTLTKAGDMYKTKKGTLISATKGFNDSLNQEWLTTKVLTSTLGDYASQTTKIGKKANAAAQDVKTFSQLLSTLQESAGSGWATSFEIIFGNIDEAKTLWTGLNNIIGGFITGASDSRNQFLQFFKDIKGFKAIVTAIMSWINPIKQAWQDIFPPTASDSFKTVAQVIKDFFTAITLNGGQMQYLREAFQGFFSALSIGWSIVKGVFGFLKDIFKLFTAGAPAAGGGLLALAAHVGQAITSFKDFLTATNAVPAFFDRLYNAVGPTVVKIREFVSTVAAAVGGALGKLPGLLDQVRGAATNADQQGLTPMQKTLNFLKATWDALVIGAQKVIDFFKMAGEAVKNAFSGLGGSNGDPGQSFVDKIKNALQNVNWANIFKATIGVGLMMFIINTVRFMMSAIQLLKSAIDIGKEWANMIQTVTGGLKTLQSNVRATIIVKIALAILLLAIALKILAGIPQDDLIVGLMVIYILLEGMDTLSKKLAKDEKGMVKAAGSMILMAIALNLLATAILMYGKMDMATLIQGVITVGVLLRMLEVAITDMGKSQNDMLKTGVGIMFIAIAMNMLASAVFMFGKMDLAVLAQGIGAVVVVVAGLSAAMRLMPKEGEMAKASASLMLIAIALNLMIIPIKQLGSMDYGQLTQGMYSVAALLVMMVLALNLMASPGVLAGAAGMLVGAAAMIVLAVALKMLSGLSLEQAGTGILIIAAAMVAIAAVSALLSPVIPMISAFGLAIMLLGGGFALLGIGMLAGATAFSIVIGLMALGVPVLKDMIQNLIDLIPLLAEGFRVTLVEFANAFTAAIPTLVNVVTTLVTQILIAITLLIPRFQAVFSAFVKAGLYTLASFAGDFITAGLLFIRKLLSGIAENLPDIIKAGTKIIVTLITGFGKAAKDILKAAGDTLLDFMEGMTKWINDNEDRIGNAGRDLAGAIISGIVSGLTGGNLNDAWEAIQKLAGGLIDKAKEFLHINSPSKDFIKIGKSITEGLVVGIAAGKQQTIDTIKNLVDGITASAATSADKIKALKDKIKGLEDKKNRTPAQRASLAQAKKDLAAEEVAVKRLAAAKRTIQVEHKTQVNQLYALGAQYEQVTQKLKDAQDAYTNAIKERDDFAKSVTSSFSKLPTFDATTTLDDYFNAIRTATEANYKFKATMEQLRKLGLDDTQYKKFLEQGTEVQPFLDQLLAAGGSTIAELNKIDGTLTDSATSLGKSASEALYQAGVNSAKGIVDGLTSEMNNITAKMKTIGKAIADELKKELGIKSPSKVFAEIGKNTIFGLAKGMDANSNVIDMSARRTGQIAVESLKKSLMGLAIDEAIDVQPVIAPVLDLDAFRKDASGMGDILATKALQATVSAQNARSISSTTEANKKALEASMALQATGTTVEFTQINNSPKALSSADIYRQTKNQLSIAKGALPG